MDLKPIVVIVLFLVSLALIFLAPPLEKPIGGDRDEHGCLSPAGYTWSDDVGACIRAWEITETMIDAAKMAVNYHGQEYGLTIVEVLVARCPGCFAVKLTDIDYRQISIIISNWTVSNAEESLTPTECINLGGRTVNIVGGDTCYDNETFAGNVTGFISPNICCLLNE